MRESALINEIIKKAYSRGNVIFRVNVGRFKLPSGKWFSTGVPKGFSDLVGFRPDGKIFFLEVKVKPNIPTTEQLKFIEDMKNSGAIAGVAWSVSEAIDIINERL